MSKIFILFYIIIRPVVSMAKEGDRAPLFKIPRPENKSRTDVPSWMVKLSLTDLLSNTVNVSGEYVMKNMEAIDFALKFRDSFFEQSSYKYRAFSVNVGFKFYQPRSKSQTIDELRYFKRGFFVRPGMSLTVYEEKNILLERFMNGGKYYKSYTSYYFFDRSVRSFGVHLDFGMTHVFWKHWVLQYSGGLSLNGYLKNTQSDMRDAPEFFEYSGNEVEDDQPFDPARFSNTIYGDSNLGFNLGLNMGYRF